MTATPLDSLPIGIVVERRASASPWIDHTWRAVELLPGAPEGPWRPLGQGDGWARFFAGTRTLELFRKETEGYRSNLSEEVPVLYVVLKIDEDADGEERAVPFLVTACPYEAESYGESGEDIIDGVPMSPALVARVQTFVDTHHVDQPFVKRKQKNKNKGLPHDE